MGLIQYRDKLGIRCLLVQPLSQTKTRDFLLSLCSSSERWFFVFFFFSRLNHCPVEAGGIFAMDLNGSSFASYFSFVFPLFFWRVKSQWETDPLGIQQARKIRSTCFPLPKRYTWYYSFRRVHLVSSVPPSEGMANSFESDPPLHAPNCSPQYPFPSLCPCPVPGLELKGSSAPIYALKVLERSVFMWIPNTLEEARLPPPELGLKAPKRELNPWKAAPWLWVLTISTGNCLLMHLLHCHSGNWGLWCFSIPCYGKKQLCKPMHWQNLWAPAVY